MSGCTISAWTHMVDQRNGSVTVLGAPYDAASSFLRGAAAAPTAIRRALWSESTNAWTENLVDLGGPRGLSDAGDIDVGGPEVARDRIEAAVWAQLAGGRRPIVLGGDHSITYPVIRAVRRHHPRLALLHLDAHPDLYDEFAGDRHSHACPFARIMEEHGADRLIQIGIRTINQHQRAQADRFGVEVITMREWTDDRSFAFDMPVYISIDVDVLDPAFAPGVSHREPGGLSTRQVIALLQRLRGTIVAADVVEFNPANDPVGLTAPVCAKLVKELAARMLEADTTPGQYAARR